MSAKNFISTNALAKELGIDRSAFKKYLKLPRVQNLGIQVQKVRLSESGNQLCSVLSLSDAAIIRKDRFENFSILPSKDHSCSVFYAISLIDLSHCEAGASRQIRFFLLERLGSACRGTALGAGGRPFKDLALPSFLEKPAMDYVSRFGKRVCSEVFDFPGKIFVDRLDTFFEMLSGS